MFSNTPNNISRIRFLGLGLDGIVEVVVACRRRVVNDDDGDKLLLL